jgi:hypothetical protein
VVCLSLFSFKQSLLRFKSDEYLLVLIGVVQTSNFDGSLESLLHLGGGFPAGHVCKK